MAADRSRVVHFMAPSNRKLDEGGLHVWDLLPDGTQAKYELVHGCENRLGFEIASAALLYPDSKRSVELCGSRAVRFERNPTSDRKGTLSSSSCSSREGHLTSSDDNELSESTDSMLLMRVEDDFDGEVVESDDMRCCL
jgi:hypothetical protein